MGEYIFPVIATLVIIGVIYFAANQSSEDIVSVADTDTKSCPMCGTDATMDVAECVCGYAFVTHKSTSLEASHVAPVPQEASAAATWNVVGWLMGIGGLIGLIVALYMDTSVKTYVPADILGPGGSPDVVNLDLLFRKGVAIACSLSAIAVGIFCIGIGAIIRAIDSKGR